MVSRILWISIPYLLLIEVFSVLPLRVNEDRRGSAPFLTGAVHLPVGRGGLENKLERLAAAAQKAHLDFVVLANQDKVFPPARPEPGTEWILHGDGSDHSRGSRALFRFAHRRGSIPG